MPFLVWYELGLGTPLYIFNVITATILSRVVLLNGLAGSRGIQMSKTHLTATITMAVRPWAAADHSDKLVTHLDAPVAFPFFLPFPTLP